MKYTIIEASSASKLSRKVQAALNEGWALQGGVAVATYAAGAWWYYQAMVSRSEDEAELVDDNADD